VERRADLNLVITKASFDELSEHEKLLDKIAESGACVWRRKD
jgi:hypothetical protein